MGLQRVESQPFPYSMILQLSLMTTSFIENMVQTTMVQKKHYVNWHPKFQTLLGLTMHVVCNCVSRRLLWRAILEVLGCHVHKLPIQYYASTEVSFIIEYLFTLWHFEQHIGILEMISLRYSMQVHSSQLLDHCVIQAYDI